MSAYTIDFFGEKKIKYSGSLVDAMMYADDYARHHVFSYKGRISILDKDGFEWATQNYKRNDDGSLEDDGWGGIVL